MAKLLVIMLGVMVLGVLACGNEGFTPEDIEGAWTNSITITSDTCGLGGTFASAGSMDVMIAVGTMTMKGGTETYTGSVDGDGSFSLKGRFETTPSYGGVFPTTVTVEGIGIVSFDGKANASEMSGTFKMDMTFTKTTKTFSQGTMTPTTTSETSSCSASGTFVGQKS